MNNKMKNKWFSFGLTLVMGCAVSLLAVFILQYYHFQLDYERTVQFIDTKTRLNVMEGGIVFLVFLWFYFLAGSGWLSSFLVLLLSFVLGVATQQKLLYRGEPLYPSDAYFLKDFRFLIGVADTPILVIAGIAAVLLVGAIVYFFVKRKRVSKGLLLVRLIGFLIVSSLLFYVSQFNQPGNKVHAMFSKRVSWIPYSQEKNYSANGVVSGLMYNFKAPALDKPENYNKASIQALYEKYNREAEKINNERKGSLEDINIIFIMNETFSDPLQIKGLSISEDPIPRFREFTKENVHGEAFSQGYGGGTANIEFEALTGVSLEPLASNITTPFIQLSGQMKKFPSLMDYLSSTRHNLTAIHPYNTTMYKRLENYQALNFDSYIFKDDMKDTSRIDKNYYISDEAAYNEVLDVLHASKGKEFIHLVTMQNHTPFLDVYNNLDFEVEGAPNNLEAAHYVQGLSYSDIALKNLIDEINQLNEKTLVVFWGDHLPAFYGDELYESNGHVTMHETPLLFYSNFSDDVYDVGTISPIYFINHILSLTNSPVTPFTALLQNMEKFIPAMEKGYYLEKGSDLKNNRSELGSDTREVLNEYDLILYDITAGKNYSKELGFF